MSVFQERWWLDAANPERWREVTVVDKGKVVGRWPYSQYSRLGLRLGGMAPLTSTLGPWIAPLAGGVIAQRKREIHLVTALAQQLPACAFFRQVLAPTVENALPFQICGFQIDVEQTFEIDTAQGLDRLWDGFQDKLRNQIRRSNRDETLAHDVGVDEFLAVHAANMAARGVEDRLDAGAFRRLHAACVPRRSGRILGLRNRQGDATAALFVVESPERMHHLIQTRHPVLATAGAVEALTWSAMGLAQARGLVYDLDGVPNASAAFRLLRYGGRPKNRFIVTRGAPMLLAARSFYKTAAYRLGRHKRFV